MKVKNKKNKNKIMELSGDTTIYFSDFPAWEEFPPRWESHYTDSKAFEFEVENDSFTYVVIVLVNIRYKRWFLPETYENPCEDEITDFEFTIEAIKGEMTHKSTEVTLPLNDKELEEIKDYIVKNLNIKE